MSFATLEPVRLAGRHSLDRVSGAGAGDGTLVAVDTMVVSDLQMERAVAEHRAALHAFGATDAERFVDRVFVVWVFDELPLDRAGRAELVFSGGGEFVGLRLKVTGAELAIAAHVETVDAFHRRLFQHAFRRAPAALRTFPRVNLPDRAGGASAPDQTQKHTAQADHAGTTHDVAEKIPAIHRRTVFHGSAQPVYCVQPLHTPLPAHERRSNTQATAPIPASQSARRKSRRVCGSAFMPVSE